MHNMFHCHFNIEDELVSCIINWQSIDFFEQELLGWSIKRIIEPSDEVQ
jgi:hypothetical protein